MSKNEMGGLTLIVIAYIAYIGVAGYFESRSQDYRRCLDAQKTVTVDLRCAP